VFAKITFIPAALLIGVWFISQLLHAGAVAQVQSGGVAYLAHVGGFVFGAIFARWFEGSPRVAED
jgi:membrane associated rhomboid family serine protease